MDTLSTGNRDRSGRPGVLVVDDDPLVLAVMTRILAKRYTVHEANNAQEALALCAECDAIPNLLVTDVRLPGLSGTELAKELTRQHPNLSVLYVSGFHDELAQSKLTSRERFLVKPFSADTLSKSVGTLLGHASPVCSACGKQTFRSVSILDDGTTVLATFACGSCENATTSILDLRANTRFSRCPLDDGPMVPSSYGYIGPDGHVWNAVCLSCAATLQTRSHGLLTIPW